MDIRKKTIAELETKKRETAHSLDLLYEKLGAALFDRLQEGKIDSEGPFLADERSEFTRIGKEISDFEDLIRAIETDTLRLKKLEEQINQKEQDLSAGRGELSSLYRTLGRSIMEDGRFADHCEPFGHQIENLLSKIDSQERRDEDLKNTDSGNVFTWIGVSAQKMLNHGFMAKNRKALDRLYEKTGETFVKDELPVLEGELAELIAQIANMKMSSQALSESLTVLREERRTIGDNINVEGGPVRRIQNLERFISHKQEELQDLYRRVGGLACEGKRKKDFSALLRDEDNGPLAEAESFRKTIKDCEKQLDKLRAAIAIDEEKAEIVRMQKALAERHEEIETAEQAIAALEENIEKSGKNIAELEKRL